MTRLFQIHIDLGLLRNNLSREEGRDVSDAEVGGWLNDSGFKPTGDGWTVEESNLGQLDPSEVISAEVVAAGAAMGRSQTT